MADFNTFETTLSDINDPLLREQHEDVSRMRASLLKYNDGSLESARYAISNVTVLRVYHQVTRIVRYLNLMDKIEEKLYESIEHSLSVMDTNSPASWLMLLNIQEKLQKNMIESHKLLQPYLTEDMQQIYSAAVSAPVETSAQSLQLDRNTRDKLRTSAQQVLLALNSIENSGGVENEPDEDI